MVGAAMLPIMKAGKMKIVHLVAALLVAAPPVVAQDSQLGSGLQLAQGQFSVLELMAIKHSRDDNNLNLERATFRARDARVSGGVGIAARGGRQHAGSVGEEIGKFSSADLQSLGRAKEESNSAQLHFLRNGTGYVGSRDDVGASSRAKTQLASGMNLDPEVFTTSELARMRLFQLSREDD